jgi:hypothetical protein
MAKIKLDPMFSGMSGKFGGLVFRQRPDGTTVVSRAPAKSNNKPSPAQLKQRQRLKEAAAYAAEILADPEGSAWYQQRARRSKTTPRALAVKDYMKLPIPEALPASGSVLPQFTDRPSGRVFWNEK